MFVLENLLRNEVFPVELPPCFDTNSLADKSADVLSALQIINQKDSVALKYSGYKSETSRRKFALPNPYHYCKAAEVIVNYEAYLIPIFEKSSYSLTSPIDKKPSSSQAYVKRTSSIAETKEEIEKLYQNNRYEIRLDITSFFDSIYTHSIPWAIHTIEVAKERRRDDSLVGNKLDKCMQAMNYSQTNGVLVGNAISRIISEIILCTVDESIEKKFPELLCCRFVDDYYIYTQSNSNIQEIISFIRSNLFQYELSFNENKLQINESPFLYGKSWVEQIKQYIHLPPDIFLSKLVIEYNEYKDISIIKYGLKILSHRILTEKKWPILQSKLINLWVRFPSLSNLVLDILWCNKDKVNKELLEKAIHTIIEESISLNRDQELVWAVWFAKVFGTSLSENQIISILASSNDIAIIVLLDYIYSNQLERVIPISDQLSLLYDRLTNEDIDASGNANQLMWTSHWLLAYEADRNKWLNIQGKTFDYAQRNRFFKRLLDLGVFFYNKSFAYTFSAEQSSNIEYVTQNELSIAINKLIEMINARLDALEPTDEFKMTLDESELYEYIFDLWEQQDNIYV